MATLQTADGRLLRTARPIGMGSSLPSVFPPMWSDGEREGEGGRLLSYANVYNSQPAVAGVVNKLAKRISTLPFDAYISKGNRARELLTDDSLATLVLRPWPRGSTLVLLHFIAQSLLVHGNAIVGKVRGSEQDSPPEMLLPLHWSAASAYAPEGGTIEWWSTTQYDGRERFVPASEVIHFAWKAPESELGVSPLQQLQTTIQNEDAAQRYQLAAFRNANRPGGVLTLPPSDKKLDQEVLQLTRDTLNAIHGGVDNAFKIGLVAPGAKWEPMTTSMVEAELIEQRRLNWEEVGMVYDLAGPLMNDLRRSTYSNVEELNKALYRDVVPPWLGLIEKTFQSQLLDQEPAWFDRFLSFDLSDKLKGEPKELAETLKLQVEAGLITRNEARRILNMPPHGDPDDESNPANQLTANTNNQNPLGGITRAEAGFPPIAAPASQE